MHAKIVCRLLDKDNQLLGWCEHFAIARGDGLLRSESDVYIPVEKAGVPVCVSLHWCEVNVETKVPVPNVIVQPGHLIPIYPPNEPMLTIGLPPVGLPQVTVGKPVTIGVPAGQMGGVPHAGNLNIS